MLFPPFQKGSLWSLQYKFHFFLELRNPFKTINKHYISLSSLPEIELRCILTRMIDFVYNASSQPFNDGLQE